MFKISYIYDLIDNISPQLKQIQANLETTKNKVASSAQSISSSFDKIRNKLDLVGKKAINLGKDMFLKTTLPISVIGVSFIKAASDYTESINKVDVAFGNASQSVKDFAKSSGKNFGIDIGTALDMSAMFGDMSTSMGISQIRASELSTSLVGLAGDLASFKNMRIGEVQTALSGIFTGETESLKRLGVVMTEENLNQFLTSKGIGKQMKDLSQAEKVLQRYSYVVQMTSNSHGDFIRTQTGFANQMRIATSAYKDLSIQLGIAILPYATQFLGFLIKGIKLFQNLSPETQKFILIATGLLAILPPLAIAFGAVLLSIKGLVAGFVFLATPVGMITASIIALISTIYLMKDSFVIVYDFLKDKFASVFDYIAEKIMKVIGLVNDFRTNTATILDFAGFSNAANFVAPEINQSPQINRPQSLTAGGELNVNIRGLPKGSNAGFTPRPNNFLPVGINSVFAGS